MQSADFLSAVFFYLKEGENLNQNWIVENLNNAFSTWNGKLGELWGLVTTGPQTFKGGAVWSVMQTLHNGMVGIGYALVVLFFAISLCKNTMNFHELKRPEAAIHYFLRFVAAKALVGYGMEIMLNVFSICNGIVTDMADSMGGISEAMVSLPAEMQTAIENVGFLASIPLWLVTILGSLFITVLSFVMILTVYGRFFRLYIHSALPDHQGFVGGAEQSGRQPFQRIGTCTGNFRNRQYAGVRPAYKCGYEQPPDLLQHPELGGTAKASCHAVHAGVHQYRRDEQRTQ